MPFDPADVPGKKYFHARDLKEVPQQEKVKPKAKFAKRHLVLQAMDEFGNVSKPFYSKGTMTLKIYLEQCIKKILIPYILQHHN